MTENTENVRKYFQFSRITHTRRHYSELEYNLHCDTLRHLVGIDTPPRLLPTQDKTTHKERTFSKMEVAGSSERLISTRPQSPT